MLFWSATAVHPLTTVLRAGFTGTTLLSPKPDSRARFCTGSDSAKGQGFFLPEEFPLKVFYTSHGNSSSLPADGDNVIEHMTVF